MAKRGRKSRSEIIKEEAEAAAEDIVQNFEDQEEEDNESSFEDDGTTLDFGQSNAGDVFEEGFSRAIAMKDSPRFHIKKNSQFLTVKDWPYSWEQLQKEYGPGYYQVICKARSNGRIIKQQTEAVGDPNEGRPQPAPETSATEKTDNNLAVLGWLQQSQERAEERAREIAKQSEGNMAGVLQAITAAQTKSAEMMMQMMMESSKQTQNLLLAMMQNQNQPKGPDPVMTLLTTLLTKNDGFTAASVMKMVQDAESRAETRATKQYELIEKKADELATIKAEAMSSGDEEKEESLSKTLLKGFMPVLTQIVAQQPQAPQPLRQAQPVPVTDTGTRPAIAAPPTPAQRPQQAGPQARPATKTAQSGPIALPHEPPTAAKSRPKVALGALNEQQKETVFNFVAMDIVQAMVDGKNGAIAAEEVLVKLEKQGMSRQTVAQGFTLQDFHGYADKFIPAESLEAAKAWLKDFHDAIQKTSGPAQQPVTAAQPIPAPVPSKDTAGNGIERGNAVSPVPVKRSSATRGAGAPARTPAKTV